MATYTAVWWIGAGLAIVGPLISIGRLVFHQVLRFLPFGTGILALGSGIAVMWIADLLAAHWWIMPILMALLIAIGIVEYLGRDKVKQWAGRKLNELKDEAL